MSKPFQRIQWWLVYLMLFGIGASGLALVLVATVPPQMLKYDRSQLDKTNGKIQPRAMP